MQTPRNMTPPYFVRENQYLHDENPKTKIIINMKTKSFEDPRLVKAILGHRRRIVRHIVISVPIDESIEFKIIQKKKELNMIGGPKYQVMMFNKWHDISLDRYQDLQRTNESLPVNQQFKLRLL